MENEVKKSYNPFKMWGSWIGLGISFFYILGYLSISSSPSFFRVYSFLFGWFFYPLLFLTQGCDQMGCAINFLIIFIISPIYGFIIGWVVHSLFRKMRWDYIHKNKKFWFWLVIILIILFMAYYSFFMTYYSGL